MTDDDLTRIDGQRQQLLGTLQEKYGLAKDEARKQIEEFESSCNC